MAEREFIGEFKLWQTPNWHCSMTNVKCMQQTLQLAYFRFFPLNPLLLLGCRKKCTIAFHGQWNDPDISFFKILTFSHEYYLECNKNS